MLSESILGPKQVLVAASKGIDGIVAPVRIEHVPPCRFHTLVSFSGCAGAFCDGYTIGVMGAVLPYAAAALHASAWGTGLLSSGTLFGLLLGTLIAGYAADRWGRKPLLQSGIISTGFISLLQLFPLPLTLLFVVRFALGFALAADYVAGSSYQTEFLPQKTRGKQVSLLLVNWSLGFAVAFQVAFVIGPLSDLGWRLSLALGAIPAFAAYLVRSRLPESIVWLVARARHAEASDIAKFFFSGHDIDITIPDSTEVDDVQSGVIERGEVAKRLFIAFLFMATHLIPYFFVGTFSIDLFKTIGITTPYLDGVIYTLFLVFGSLIGRKYIDLLPRNVFIATTMTVPSLILIILSLHVVISPVVQIALFSIFALMLSASCCIDYVYLPELFPARLRASCNGLVQSTSRTCIALSTLLIPTLFVSYGTDALLWLNAAILCLGASVCLVFAPDTRSSRS